MLLLALVVLGVCAQSVVAQAKAPPAVAAAAASVAGFDATLYRRTTTKTTLLASASGGSFTSTAHVCLCRWRSRLHMFAGRRALWRPAAAPPLGGRRKVSLCASWCRPAQRRHPQHNTPRAQAPSATQNTHTKKRTPPNNTSQHIQHTPSPLFCCSGARRCGCACAKRHRQATGASPSPVLLQSSRQATWRATRSSGAASGGASVATTTKTTLLLPRFLEGELSSTRMCVRLCR